MKHKKLRGYTLLASIVLPIFASSSNAMADVKTKGNVSIKSAYDQPSQASTIDLAGKNNNADKVSPVTPDSSSNVTNGTNNGSKEQSGNSQVNSDKAEEQKIKEKVAVTKAAPMKEDRSLGAGLYTSSDSPVNLVEYASYVATYSNSEFLNAIKKGAIDGWKNYHVLPSVTAAQAILESGWGNSALAVQGHNLFGIKGDFNGQFISFPTQEYVNGHYVTVQANFRKYPSFHESIDDHGVFLNVNPRYSNLLGVKDYATVTRLLSQDGYATAPDYAPLLNQLIRANGLDAWDREAFNGGRTNPNPNLALHGESGKNGVVFVKSAKTRIRYTDGSQGDYLNNGTRWQVYGVAYDTSGTPFYKVSKDGYIPALDLKYISPANDTRSLITNQKEIPNDVVRVSVRDGAIVRDSSGNDKRVLNYNGTFKTWLVGKDSQGRLWYKVGNDEFVSASEVIFEKRNPLSFTDVTRKTTSGYVKSANGAVLTDVYGNHKDVLKYGAPIHATHVSKDQHGEEYLKVNGSNYVKKNDVYTGDNESSSRLTYKANINGVVHVTNKNGAMLKNINGKYLRALPSDSNWKAFGYAVDQNGNKWYKVSTDEYISEKDVELSNYADSSKELSNFKSLNGVININAKDGSVIRTSNGSNGQRLSFNTNWKVFGTAKDKSGVLWYLVSNDGYISSQDSDMLNVSNVANKLTTVATKSGIAHVTSNNGAMMRNMSGANIGRLDNGSNWKIFGIAQDAQGNLWYKVSTDGYISAANSKLI